MTTDILGVPLVVGQRVLYAFAWNLLAELRVGTLVRVDPVPVIRADSTGQLNTRPACAVVVLTEDGVILRAEAEAWLRRQMPG